MADTILDIFNLYIWTDYFVCLFLCLLWILSVPLVCTVNATEVNKVKNGAFFKKGQKRESCA